VLNRPGREHTQQGFLQGPEKEGDAKAAHVLRCSSHLTPRCPFVLSVLNLRAALGKNLLVLKISVLPPKLSREWNSRTSEQWDSDRRVWKPLATGTGLSSRSQEICSAFTLATRFYYDLRQETLPFI